MLSSGEKAMRAAAPEGYELIIHQKIKIEKLSSSLSSIESLCWVLYERATIVVYIADESILSNIQEK